VAVIPFFDWTIKESARAWLRLPSGYARVGHRNRHQAGGNDRG